MKDKIEFLMIPYKMLKMEITPRALLLYGIIYKLSASMKHDSYATNKYFMKELDVNSNKTIYNLLDELEKKDCISIRYDEQNPNIRYITPKITNEVKVISDENPKKNGWYDSWGMFHEIEEL